MGSIYNNIYIFLELLRIVSLTSQLITVKNIFYKGISGFIQCLDFLGKMSGFFPKNVWIYPDVVWIFSEKLWGPMI